MFILFSKIPVEQRVPVDYSSSDCVMAQNRPEVFSSSLSGCLGVRFHDWFYSIFGFLAVLRCLLIAIPLVVFPNFYIILGV